MIVAALVGVIVGCAGTVGVALARGISSGTAERPTAEQSAAPVTVPVTSQVLVDSEVVSGALSWADTAQVVATDGVVTAMPLADGSEIVPGHVVIEVNDRPIVALHMRFGPWRDLALGDSGADVRELHAALAELGRFGGDVDAAVDEATFSALAGIDPRLGAAPLAAASLVAVDATGSNLEAPGVGVGSRLGEATVAVRRHSDQIAIDDGGLAEQYATAGQQIELFDASGASVWVGEISEVKVESARTLLTISGDEDLPTELGTAAIVVASTEGEVLAVPRVAITPEPDGTSSITVVSSPDGTRTETSEVAVTTGLCARDLCEITFDASAAQAPEAGSLVLVP
ncbi:MAG TPA: hypothetical protein VGC37_00580 [Friedmanniella sp.]